MSKQKRLEYATKVYDQLVSMFDEDSENYIDLLEFEDSDNATDFIHAVANMAPTMIFSRLTEEEVNYLEFNHIANHLCFQFGNMEKEQE